MLLLLLLVALETVQTNSINLRTILDHPNRAAAVGLSRTAALNNDFEEDSVENSTASSQPSDSISTIQFTESSQCIQKCWTGDDERTESILESNAFRFGDSDDHLGAIDPNTLEALAVVFHELCGSAHETLRCFQRCPQSNLRQLAVHDYREDARMCDPERYFPTFSEYHKSVQCINRVLQSKPCVALCRPWLPIESVTGFQVERGPSDLMVRFNTEMDTNTAAVREACATFSCHRDCKEHPMTSECGLPAFGMYVRMAKLEPSRALGSLQILNAVETQIPECADWQ